MKLRKFWRIIKLLITECTAIAQSDERRAYGLGTAPVK